MNYFIIGYYALLIGCSCAGRLLPETGSLPAAVLTDPGLLHHGDHRRRVGAVDGHRLAGLIALSAGTAFAFREFLVIIAPRETAKALRTAPLTASFGLFVIGTYAIAGIFAPIIAPFGEAEVITDAFAPADENMLLGADQLGRDMFSRLVYGARNTVGLGPAGDHLRIRAGRNRRTDRGHQGRLVRSVHGSPGGCDHVHTLLDLSHCCC